MDWCKFWLLFHETWGDNKELEYNKKNWIEMQRVLEKLEIDWDRRKK